MAYQFNRTGSEIEALQDKVAEGELSANNGAVKMDSNGIAWQTKDLASADPVVGGNGWEPLGVTSYASSSSSAYVVTDSGIIYQAFRDTYTAGAVDKTVNLPIAFPNDIISWVGSSDDVLSNSAEIVTRRGETNSSVTYFVSDGSGAPIQSNATVYFIAIGR